MSTVLQAALLGVVQGVTEFLPVSSTAHLILARVFFGFDGDQFGLAFDVALHVGTLLAVVVYFRDQIARMVAALPRLFQPARDQWARMIWLLAIGTIPAVVVGLFFGDVIEDRLRTVPVVAATLAIVALGLFWAERATANTRSESSITFVEAFAIGCAQAAALVPGVSRSGATLIAALAIGLRRTEAAQFIFLLAIPAILGAAVREIPAILRAESAGNAALFAIGVVTSAVVGYVVIKFFIRYLARHSLDVFAWYRLALSGAAMVWLAVAPS